MEPENMEAVWLTDDYKYSIAEFTRLSGLSDVELHELIDYGTVAPVNPDSAQWVFTEKSLQIVRTACQLRTSFDLEWHAVALLAALLIRINDLEAQLGYLRIRMPHHVD